MPMASVSISMLKRRVIMFPFNSQAAWEPPPAQRAWTRGAFTWPSLSLLGVGDPRAPAPCGSVVLTGLGSHTYLASFPPQQSVAIFV